MYLIGHLIPRVIFWFGIAVVAYLTTAPVSQLVSVTPDTLLPSGEGIHDKVEHFASYAALAGMGIIGYSGRRSAITLMMGLLAFGISLELAQIFVPGRSPGIDDVVANVLGTLAGASIAKLICRKWPSRVTVGANT
jgi:VanZ family protein